MGKITKNEIATWIRTLIPYLENPVMLSPKGCLREQQYVKPGKIIEYDSALMPRAPQVLLQTENLKALIELYKVAEQEEYNNDK